MLTYQFFTAIEDDEGFEIKAGSLTAAKSRYSQLFPDMPFVDVSVKRGSHGGARPGAGQPSKHGCKTKPIRVPEELAEKQDLIFAIPELIKKLDEWEQDCKDNPQSVRRYFLREALDDFRNLGF